MAPMSFRFLSGDNVSNMESFSLIPGACFAIEFTEERKAGARPCTEAVPTVFIVLSPSGHAVTLDGNAKCFGTG